MLTWPLYFSEHRLQCTRYSDCVYYYYHFILLEEGTTGAKRLSEGVEELLVHLRGRITRNKITEDHVIIYLKFKIVMDLGSVSQDFVPTPSASESFA